MHRVQEYSNEPFTVSARKIFHNGCREELSLKRSSLNNHIKCSKRKERRIKLAIKDKREKSITIALKRHNEQSHLVGKNLPEQHQIFCVKVICTFLRAGIPLKNSYRSTDKKEFI